MSAPLPVFDTDILSEFARRNPKAVACLRATPASLWCITVISEIELLQGRFQAFQGADTPERLCEAQERLDTTRRFLQTSFPVVLGIDQETAGLFFRWLQARGLKKIGRRDLLIAAITVRHGGILVTGNTA